MRLGISEMVAFLGYVRRERMPQVYHDADIFVLPSQQEGMSIALLEAMASGLPVIVTPTGGTEELVTKGVNGDIVPWADVAALALALKRLVEDEGARVRMGAESRRRAIRFGWPALAARYLELCDQVVRGTVAQGRLEAFAAGDVSEDRPKEFRT
jgi:glycosyltransferase involved in cell wall biosynthesis